MITNKNQLFLELQPCGTFFFGNERTFNTAEKDKYDEDVTNYFAESNKYPQQTAILGLLRHTLLSLYDQLEAKVAVKQGIIGEINFDGEHSKQYGYIDSISPLVVSNRKDKNSFEFLIPAPYIKQGEIELIYSEIESKSLYIKKINKTPILKNLIIKVFQPKYNGKINQIKLKIMRFFIN